ncbi:MAG: OmpA family protein [Deltaproteobacteria bacterium]|nr:OmpA family protein [Deltaproteobacteria bacterium]
MQGRRANSLLTLQYGLLAYLWALGLTWACSGTAAYGIDLQTFAPFADNNPLVSVLGAAALEPGECWAGIYANHAREPLQQEDQAVAGAKLKALSALTIAPSCGLTANLGILASAPVNWVTAQRADGSMNTATNNAATKGQVGDAQVALRWTLIPRAVPFTGRSVALAPVMKLGRSTTVPTDGTSLTAGSDGAVSGGLKLLYDQYLTPNNYIAANFDYAHRSDQSLYGQKLGAEWRFGLGYSYMIEPLSGLSAFASWQGRRSVTWQAGAALSTSIESQVGISAKPLGDRMGIFLGAGRGLGDGYGAPVARLFAGIEFTVSKVTPPAKPFVESEIPPPEVSSNDPGSLRLNLRDSKRKDVAFSLRGGSALTTKSGAVLSGTVMGGGPFFQAMSPGIYTLDVKASGYSKRSEQLVVSPGVTSLVEVTPRSRGELSIIVRLEVPPIQFETKKAVIKTQSYADLDRLAKILSDTESIQLLAIEGHTDNVGARDRNIKLSLARANAVQAYLITKGVNPRRLTAKGFGPDDPVSSNETDLGRGRNRRVEFVIQAVKPSR